MNANLKERVVQRPFAYALHIAHAHGRNYLFFYLFHKKEKGPVFSV
jgi:hypothetical protein